MLVNIDQDRARACKRLWFLGSDLHPIFGSCLRPGVNCFKSWLGVVSIVHSGVLFSSFLHGGVFFLMLVPFMVHLLYYLVQLIHVLIPTFFFIFLSMFSVFGVNHLINFELNQILLSHMPSILFPSTDITLLLMFALTLLCAHISYSNKYKAIYLVHHLERK